MGVVQRAGWTVAVVIAGAVLAVTACSSDGEGDATTVPVSIPVATPPSTSPGPTSSGPTATAVVTTAPATTTAPSTAASTSGPPSTPTPATSSSSTTIPPTTLPPPETVVTVAPTIPGGPPTTEVIEGTDLIDIGDASIAGQPLFEPVIVDDMIDRVSDVLDDPTQDSGWRPMPAPDWDCTGNEEFRVVRWNDFRLTFERSTDGQRLTAWSLGSPDVDTLAPSVPPDADVGSSGVRTTNDIAVGSPRSALAGQDIIDETPERVSIAAGANYVAFLLDGNTITALGSGRLDCF